MEDVAAGRARIRDVAREHSVEAREDMAEWGAELKQAARGDTLPGEAHVKDLPPQFGQQVQDVVRETPTKSGTEKPGTTLRR